MQTSYSKDMGSGLFFSILASGSRGNSVYISDGTTSILIDAGLSGKEMERRLMLIGVNPKTINAIVVTHEHRDHISGVGVMSRKFDIPVYINKKTARASLNITGNIKKSVTFENGDDFSISNIKLHAFSTSHDAADPSGFTITKKDCKIGIATDLGVTASIVKQHLRGCRALIIEANHDVDMLQKGPYPWPVKQRIKSTRGHLSNRESKELLSEIQHNQLKCVILAHISMHNNTFDKAMHEAGSGLTRYTPRLIAAPQEGLNEIIYV